MKFLKIFSSLLAVVMISCSSEHELVQSKDVSVESADDLTSLIVNFYNDVNGQKTRSSAHLQIKGISKKYFDIKDGAELGYSTRGTEEDFSISNVSFEIDGKEGYCYI